MRFTESPIRGAWIIDPEPHTDIRGRFMRVWSVDEFAAHGIDFVPVQANVAFNHLAGTTRGLHYQVEPHLEGKRVRCTRGAMFDVLVDLRPGSPTYGEGYGTKLTPDSARMLYVPPMCGHGYQTSSMPRRWSIRPPRHLRRRLRAAYDSMIPPSLFGGP